MFSILLGLPHFLSSDPCSTNGRKRSQILSYLKLQVKFHSKKKKRVAYFVTKVWLYNSGLLFPLCCIASLEKNSLLLFFRGALLTSKHFEVFHFEVFSPQLYEPMGFPQAELWSIKLARVMRLGCGSVRLVPPEITVTWNFLRRGSTSQFSLKYIVNFAKS